jgi:WD40 repeat protein
MFSFSLYFYFIDQTNWMRKTKNVRCSSFRSDGRLLVAGGDDRRLRVFNVANKGLLKQLKGHSGPIQDACFTQDPSKLLSVSEDQTVKLWDLTSDNAIHTFEGHQVSFNNLKRNHSLL